MALTRKQTALLHVAKKQLALTDEDYRAILHAEARAKSSRELDAIGFEAVIQRFMTLGFTPTSAQRRARASYGHRAGMATPEQLDAIRGMWDRWSEGRGGGAAFRQWLHRTCKVSHERFLTHEQASKAMTGLRVMTRRAAEKARSAPRARASQAGGGGER